MNADLNQTPLPELARRFDALQAELDRLLAEQRAVSVAMVDRVAVVTGEGLSFQGLCERVLELVVRAYGVPREVLLSEVRSEPGATARAVAMALIRERSGCSYQMAAAALGRDEHGSAVVATKKVAALVATDGLERARVQALRRALGGPAR